MSKESLNHVFNGSNFMFCFVILKRSMGGREPENKTIMITKIEEIIHCPTHAHYHIENI